MCTPHPGFLQSAEGCDWQRAQHQTELNITWHCPADLCSAPLPVLITLIEVCADLQVTVLDVLDQEGALHLLPSLEQVSSMSSQLPARVQPLFLAKAAPAEVVQMYRRLLVEGRLQKASELQSLPHSMAVRHSA